MANDKPTDTVISMSVTSKPRLLRLITYMCPSQPIQLYELIQEMLEESLGFHTTLIYESRASGPLPDREDPFEIDQVDLAFMSPASYMKLKNSDKSSFCELIPVTPVFTHPKNTQLEPGYYADVIVHRDKTNHNVSDLMDLRGSNFAYSSEDSLSGSVIVLKALNEAGENAAFFGNTVKSGSHLASAQMVLTKQAEWASVDATTLLYSKKYMQDGGKDIVVLKSIGPLPPYPIVVNSKLPAEIKTAIKDVLLTLPQKSDWKKRFAKYGVVKFVENTEDYDIQLGIIDSRKRNSISVVYY